MVDLRNQTMEVRESATPYGADPELASFTQNIVKFESLLFRTETEIFLASPNIDRLGIFISEVQSLRPELIAQQKSAIAARGAGDDSVQRLQSLLNGRLTTIAAKADEILRKSQDELADLKREELALQAGSPPPRPPVDSEGEGGDDDRMESRIVKLEEFVGEARAELRTIDVRLAKIETRIDGIDVRMATKVDIASLESTILKWFIGTAIAMVGLAFAAAKLIH